MKKIIAALEHISKWYGIGIIFLYSMLMAEFFSSIKHLIPINESVDDNIFIVISRISYFITIISGIIIWIISAFLFHLTALLFNGSSKFKQFLFASSYPYIIPVGILLSGIFFLDRIHIPTTENAIVFLTNNSTFQWIKAIINYSFIPYYILVIIFISIEEKYIIYRKDSTYLYALDSIGKTALKRNVRLGISDGNYVEIIDGIAASEKIITNYQLEK